MIQDIFQNQIKDPKELMFRILSLILSSIFFANIPLILFLIYMNYHGFFSYDFFGEGVFGLNVFFFSTSFFLLLTSFSIFGFVIPIIGKIKSKKFNRWAFYPILIYNSLSIGLLLLAVPKSLNIDLTRIALVLVIGFFITIHIAFLIYAKPSEQFISLIVVIITISYSSFVFQKQTSSLLSTGLKSFSVGGETEVVVSPKLEKSIKLKGKLILLSPKHIYIKLENSKEISTIDRSKFDVVSSKHKPSMQRNTGGGH